MSDDDEIAKAFADTIMHGRGFTRITSEGIKHIPRSEVMTEWEELNEGAWRKGHEVSRSQKAAEISQPEKLSAASPLQIANRRLWDKIQNIEKQSMAFPKIRLGIKKCSEYIMRDPYVGIVPKPK